MKGKIKDMPRKEPSFSERLQTAAKAKQAQMEKIKVTVRTNDAQATERQAERIETEKARQIRIAERKLANQVLAKHRDEARKAEQARLAQAAAEEKARKDAERAAKAEAEAALKKEQKAARDSKYAARKAQQK